ncbi:hypothetical protein WJX82_006852 [Trebouxia sp. C0006]
MCSVLARAAQSVAFRADTTLSLVISAKAAGGCGSHDSGLQIYDAKDNKVNSRSLLRLPASLREQQDPKGSRSNYYALTLDTRISSCYWIDAVLESQDKQAEAIMLRLSAFDHISNIPGRLTGRSVFSSHLLAKQGRLVDIPQEMYGRGRWQAWQQDTLYHGTLLIRCKFKQSERISEPLSMAKWHDSKQPWRLCCLS